MPMNAKAICVVCQRPTSTLFSHSRGTEPMHMNCYPFSTTKFALSTS